MVRLKYTTILEVSLNNKATIGKSIMIPHIYLYGISRLFAPIVHHYLKVNITRIFGNEQVSVADIY